VGQLSSANGKTPRDGVDPEGVIASVEKALVDLERALGARQGVNRQTLIKTVKLLSLFEIYSYDNEHATFKDQCLFFLGLTLGAG
jgi:hypothetical protein